MQYTPEDYEEFYGDKSQADPLTWREWLAVFVVGVILALAAGCDAQDAANLAQTEEVVHQQKVTLMGMPCTWVAQCSNLLTDCPAKSRVCVGADLRGE